jgi:hypothetical protein
MIPENRIPTHPGGAGLLSRAAGAPRAGRPATFLQPQTLWKHPQKGAGGLFPSPALLVFMHAPTWAQTLISKRRKAP